MKEAAVTQEMSASAGCPPKNLARGLSALGHPVRIEILRHLSGMKSCCCKDVVGRLPLAQSTVSQHLKVLLAADLVRMTPEGSRSRYTVNREALMELSAAVNGLLSACCAAGDMARNEEI